MVPVVIGTTVVWFFLLRAAWRHHLLRRMLGLPAPAPVSG